MTECANERISKLLSRGKTSISSNRKAFKHYEEISKAARNHKSIVREQRRKIYDNIA